MGRSSQPRRALVIGGNRFFGRHLTLSLLQSGYEVTLLNRGQHTDDFGTSVRRIQVDRTQVVELKAALAATPPNWDLVFDQVCFTASEARSLCKILEGCAGRVIFASSQSVYGYGEGLRETELDPGRYVFATEATSADYAEAKRQAEAEFAKFPRLRPVMARLPLVVGSDDYTGRFAWHIQRCQQGLPIYFPNESARLGFIRSDLAGQTLLKIAESDLEGAVNCACPGEMMLRDLMERIEQRCAKSYVRAAQPSAENHSPYGVEKDWTMNVDKLVSAGIRLPNLSEWLGDLVREAVTS